MNPLLSTLLLLTAAQGSVLTRRQASLNSVIVQYNNDLSADELEQARKFLESLVEKSKLSSREESSSVNAEFSNVFAGFSGSFSSEDLKVLQDSPYFVSIEDNPAVTIFAPTPVSATATAPVAIQPIDASGISFIEATSTAGVSAEATGPSSNYNYRGAQYLGCMENNPLVPGENAFSYYLGVDPIYPVDYENCIIGCQTKGYQYAGAGAGLCFCDNQLQITTPSTGCSVPCEGNPTELCGGKDSAQVFGPSGSASPTTSQTIASTTSTPTSTSAPPSNDGEVLAWNGQSWGVVRIEGIPYNSQDYVPNQDISVNALVKTCASDPADVIVYVLDTGVLTTHEDFNGRASWGANFVDNVNTDQNGHGTHVASDAIGQQGGIAKNARVVAVKVMDANGSGTGDSVIQGLEWVLTQYQSNKVPSIVNLSLGTNGIVQSINNAVQALEAAGVTVVVAAGNSNADACNVSPASSDSAITVGATGNTASGAFNHDEIAQYSNWGSCVDVFAPGTDLRGASNAGNNQYVSMSGTSMASPKLAGIAAYLLGQNPSASPSTLRSQIQKLSIAAVTGNLNGSPNLLGQVAASSDSAICNQWS